MEKVLPAVEKATRYVKQMIEKELFEGDRLPAMRRLSLAAGVSVSSMVKAIAVLKQNNIVSGIERGAVYVGTEFSLVKAKPVSNGRMWEKKRAAVQQDLMHGVFSRDRMLPSAKELQVRYGVCFRTMKKILDALALEKVIVPHKKSYILPGPEKKQFQSTIVFITEGTSLGNVAAINQGMNKLIDTLEGECSHLNLNIDFVPYNFYDPDMIAKMRPRLKNDDTVIGYFINLWWFEIKEAQQRMNDLFFMLTAYQKPVAILDEIGIYQMPPQLALYRNIQVFRIAGRSAGESVARRLLSLGHQRIAFITPDFTPAWCVRRFDGLSSHYARAGLENQVKPFHLQNFSVLSDMALGLCGISRRKLEKMIAVNRTREQVEDILQRYESAQVLISRQKLDKKKVKLIQMNFKALEKLPERAMRPATYTKIWDIISNDAEQDVYDALMNELFNLVLSDSAITSWVGANDIMALSALRFLKDRSIRVPEDISVIGFDNMPQYAFENRLTTYDFNVGGIVHRMLWFIIRTEYLPEKAINKPIEVEGMLIERETTGQAKIERARG